MIHKIIDFSIKNKLLIGLFTLAIIFTGIWSATKVPLDAVPDITNNQVQVITQAPNLGTEDIEQFITYPVELAMANLPGVNEIRSVSRFGLSVVTIVFEDDMETYLPRQLVSEKLNEVKEDIPAGFGTPSIGPISTGLGEIYQYTLEVDDEFKGHYSATDLRRFQDWIVRRQMAMVKGVVEVNAFGGHLKQYEVSVRPDELKAIGLSISDVYLALEQNNQNTGGAYIEKNHYANFIRGEGLARSLEDIENIVVSNQGGYPITIKDLAKVQFGKAVRYGAFTKDGKGEAVGGMILMLKGANSNEVIKAVKARIEEIQKSLPEGVSIVPFLDRSDLIQKTTSTVSTNLMEGALIVVFVLVFLLGNWRGGLIVASTIPLSLLFAFILMNVFDVWANLMSLGAIDFGIIVDGAVIIVEGTVFLLHDKLLKNKALDGKTRDKVAYKASTKMMNSAFFGQLIILIVFIPILALEGIEGKMFQPMALTFMFAMIGVMILCLTYVPMMSALFIKMKKTDKKSWGDKIIGWLQSKYEKLLVKALQRAKAIIAFAILALGLSFLAFSRMGGEFIPQLDEGDLAFHILLKPGSSLTESVETSSKVEKIVMDNFPEVLHIMTRIGVAEVPTDPMPMDIGDCIVLLKPKDQWTSAINKEDLIEKMKRKISQVPGVNFEFTQPIEMRFNELLTGVREDIAIKLFGEDLDILSSKAEEIGRLIADIDGIGDLKVEATSGLPQMTVHYNRNKLAQYGLSINELNRLIQTAFSGGIAGVIFEGEKRFDLVVRLAEDHRQSIDDLRNLYVTLPNSSQIPLKEIAEIDYQTGPMQISRDNTNRRSYVGINVRGRDVKSLVEEIQNRLEGQLELPAGYYIRYGGAFENLERASNRLKFVVPLALILIFILIFFALKSFKQSLMIYIAIPLAAIGGVLSLWLRDMPFSISAGIGFIILFGVAVLNGLVLISSWNELKEKGVSNIDSRISQGAKRRIRPILLTALTDILGFLPMAISTSAGAEVQQPLATVLIGGMISATLLSLFILPILYRWVENRSNQKQAKSSLSMNTAFILVFVCIGGSQMNAQTNSKELNSLQEAINLGLENNGNIKVAKTNIEVQNQAKKSSYSIDKTELGMQYGQYNSYENDLALNINQSFDFPTVYTHQRKLARQKIVGSEMQLRLTQMELSRQIKSNWYLLTFLLEKEALLNFQDSLYQRFLYAAELRYQTEASSYLEYAAAQTRVMEVQNSLNILSSDILINQRQLRILINDTVNLIFKPSALELKESFNLDENANIEENPFLAFSKQQIEIADAEKDIQSAKLLPSLSVGYFNQSMIGMPLSDGGLATQSDRFQGIQAGLSIPLFFGSQSANIQSAKLKRSIAETNANYHQTVLEGQLEQKMQEVLKYQASLNYYTSKAVPQADLIISNAQKSFENGAIDYIEYFQNLNQAIDLKFNYLNTLNNYNQAAIALEYLMGQ